MSRRWTEADVKAMGYKAPLSASSVKSQSAVSKWRNVKCTYQGLKFDSLLEKDRYIELKLMEHAGAIRAVVRQVSMPLPGCDRRIRIDFMVHELDGRLRFEDAKGVMTDEWSLKRAQLRQAYGIEIELIQRA